MIIKCYNNRLAEWRYFTNCEDIRVRYFIDTVGATLEKDSEGDLIPSPVSLKEDRKFFKDFLFSDNILFITNPFDMARVDKGAEKTFFLDNISFRLKDVPFNIFRVRQDEINYTGEPNIYLMNDNGKTVDTV